MILLDTNVLSELRKKDGGRIDPHVRSWEERQAPQAFCLSAITVLEVELGILRVRPRDPAKADVLSRWLREQVLPTFAGRILPFDADAAIACAALHVPATRSDRDAMIAATALVHGLVVATRNTTDFAGLGVRLVDPWQGQRVGTGSAPE